MEICELGLYWFSVGLKAGRPVSSPVVQKCWEAQGTFLCQVLHLRVLGRVLPLLFLFS